MLELYMFLFIDVMVTPPGTPSTSDVKVKEIQAP